MMLDGLDALQLPESGVRLQPYWDGARAGKLLLPKCRPCGKIHWYPRAMCPFCLSEDIEWVQASGKGTVFSFSVMRAKQPYVIAYVRLEEGVTMMTNIVDCDLDRLAVGDTVQLLFATRAATPVPVFKPPT
jgi:uncharacterized OB-fold protein